MGKGEPKKIKDLFPAIKIPKDAIAYNAIPPLDPVELDIGHIPAHTSIKTVTDALILHIKTLEEQVAWLIGQVDALQVAHGECKKNN